MKVTLSDLADAASKRKTLLNDLSFSLVSCIAACRIALGATATVNVSISLGKPSS